jgi:hypothetical protein
MNIHLYFQCLLEPMLYFFGEVSPNGIFLFKKGERFKVFLCFSCQNLNFFFFLNCLNHEILCYILVGSQHYKDVSHFLFNFLYNQI